MANRVAGRVALPASTQPDLSATLKSKRKIVPQAPRLRGRVRGTAWKARFLESLRHNGNVAVSANYAGIHKKTAYRYRRT
jgi:hypothetical protein